MTGISVAMETPNRPEAVRSRWGEARRRFMRNPAAMAGLYLMVGLTLLAVLGPLLWVHRHNAIYPDRVAIAPTFAHLHLLGADAVGRDMVARLLAGLRVSLLVAAAATLAAFVIGAAYGAAAGVLGGAVDTVAMGLVDILSAIPFVFFVIVLMVVVRAGDAASNLELLILAIAAVEWLAIARVARDRIAALRNKEFVEAARAAGASPSQIFFRHLAPNAIGAVALCAVANLPAIVLTESLLSFIGLGVQEPLTSLGRLIKEGADQMVATPWMLVAPALTLMATLLALSLLGAGGRDAFDAKAR